MARLNNEFRMTGNLGADPEIKTFDNGSAVARLSIFVDSSYRDKDTGEKIEQGDWFDLSVYKKTSIEYVRQYGQKGSKIQVVGSVRKNVWDSKDRVNSDGSPVKESRIEFVVDGLSVVANGKHVDASDNE